MCYTIEYANSRMIDWIIVLYRFNNVYLKFIVRFVGGKKETSFSKEKDVS